MVKCWGTAISFRTTPSFLWYTVKGFIIAHKTWTKLLEFFAALQYPTVVCNYIWEASSFSESILNIHHFLPIEGRSLCFIILSITLLEWEIRALVLELLHSLASNWEVQAIVWFSIFVGTLLVGFWQIQFLQPEIILSVSHLALGICFFPIIPGQLSLQFLDYRFFFIAIFFKGVSLFSLSVFSIDF